MRSEVDNDGDDGDDGDVGDGDDGDGEASTDGPTQHRPTRLLLKAASSSVPAMSACSVCRCTADQGTAMGVAPASHAGTQASDDNVGSRRARAGARCEAKASARRWGADSLHRASAGARRVGTRACTRGGDWPGSIAGRLGSTGRWGAERNSMMSVGLVVATIVWSRSRPRPVVHPYKNRET